MRPIRTLLFFLLAALVCAAPARAITPETAADEAAIRALIDKWYAEHRAGADGYSHTLRAPGAIDASPGYYFANTRSRAAGPRLYNSFAATALKFNHEITRLVVDAFRPRAGLGARLFLRRGAAADL